MIIVSQDKDVIVNFNNVENIWINNPLENDDGKFEIRAESYSNNMIIGKYETEERVKEVLQEILIRYKATEGLKVSFNKISDKTGAFGLEKRFCLWNARKLGGSYGRRL